MTHQLVANVYKNNFSYRKPTNKTGLTSVKNTFSKSYMVDRQPYLLNGILN